MTVPTTWTAIGTQIAVGFGLFYAVVKFFDTVGDRLSEDTRLEIAVWLLGVKTEHNFQPWPDTFTQVFDRVFGRKHISWRCFVRSATLSIVMATLSGIVFLIYTGALVKYSWKYWALILVIACTAGLIANVLPDYVSLLETRLSLHLMASSQNMVLWIGIIAADVVVTLALAVVGISVANFISLVPDMSFGEAMVWGLSVVRYPSLYRVVIGNHVNQIWLVPAFFTSIWLWLYAGSGFLLKAARRFDIGFAWFSHHFDIEKKPLQSIGLVAGVIVALVYWGAVAVVRVI